MSKRFREKKERECSNLCKPTILFINGKWRVYTSPKRFQCFKNFGDALSIALETAEGRTTACKNTATRTHWKVFKFGWHQVFPPIIHRLRGMRAARHT